MWMMPSLSAGFGEQVVSSSVLFGFDIARGGSGVVSRSALLKLGCGKHQRGKQLARSSRRSSGEVSIKAQG